MLMNGVAIKSPILKLQKPKIVQNLYADIGNAVGSLQQLHEFFENLSNQGPRFGYHVNAPKCQLIVKPLTQQKAESIFAGTNVQILNGARVLGSVIGSDEDMQKFLKNKTNDYTKLIQKLSNFGKSSSQAAYHCYVIGLQNKMTFLTRTTPKSSATISSEAWRTEIVQTR